MLDWNVQWITKLILILDLTLLFAAGYVAFSRLVKIMAARRRRVSWTAMHQALTHHSPPYSLLALCGLRKREAGAYEEKAQALAGAGIRMHPLWYLAIKRLLIVCFPLTAGFVWRFQAQLQLSPSDLTPKLAAAALLGISGILLADVQIFASIKRYRMKRIVEEIYVLSHQMLYFSGSRINLHAKLARCLPHTRWIRKEWHHLLNEWYQDPEGAINRFKQKLGTEDAHGFAETLLALYKHEDETYYELLRQRIQDFKEKLEMIRDNRKESLSYVLFVLAGVPILYTFRVFIQPWVAEGKHLFEALH